MKYKIDKNTRYCRNCMYYEQYYVKRANIYNAVYGGNCNRRKKSKKLIDEIPFVMDCPYWEQMQEENRKSKDDILERIKYIKSEIEELYDIIKNTV